MDGHFSSFDFLNDLRDTARAKGKSLVGRKGLEASVMRRLVALRYIFAGAVDSYVQENMLLGVAELARRCDLPLPEGDALEAVARTLGRECTVNSAKFNNGVCVADKAFVPLTIYNGTRFLSAFDAPEFEDFRCLSGVFRRVAINNPQNPEGALRNIKRISQSLATNPEFSIFEDTPWIYLRIALTNPANPEVSMREILKSGLSARDYVCQSTARKPRANIDFEPV